MDENQSPTSGNAGFSGWAMVEIMGRDRAAGYVTTEYFGPACMFRVDTPALPEREFVLKRPQYVGDTWTPAGATVKRPESPARTRLLGVSSIFSMNPCTQEVAEAAMEEIYPRPLILLKMPERPAIAENIQTVEPQIDPVCGSEVGDTAFSAEHEGKMYHFCSSDCREEFRHAPEDYITKNEAAELGF